MNADAVLALPWVQAIRPTRPPYLHRLSEHSDLVWHVDVEFPRWPIPTDLERQWLTDNDANVKATWRKRPLVRAMEPTAPYYCGEVELAMRLRRAGFRSYWISEWSGFAHVPVWRDICIKRSELPDRAPMVHAFDQRLRASKSGRDLALGKSGGHPDVVAWHDSSPDLVFIEYKGPNDTIKPKQNAWARAVVAREVGRVPYVAVRGQFVD